VPRKDSTLSVIKQFQSETESIRESAEPVRTRATVWCLGALLVSFLGVAGFTRLDRVVESGQGKIVTVDSINTFQALDDASIIKSIDVHDGQQVQAGQLLATIDPTFTTADVTQLTQQIASLDAQIVRDQAELAKKPLVFPTNMSPELTYYAGLQKALYDQRMEQFKAQVHSYDEKIGQVEATINKLQVDEGRYQERAKISKQIEDMRQTLMDKNAGSLLNLLVSSDSKIDLLRNMEFDHNSLIESQHLLDSSRADREAFVQQWDTGISQDLVTSRNNKDSAAGLLAKASKHRDLVRITASEPSVVLTLTKLSVGSVLKAGDPIVSVAPLKSPVEAEIFLAPRDVGFVRPGDRVTLKIDAFNYAEHGTAEGELSWVSEGAFTTDDNGQPIDPYYKARVKIGTLHFVGVPANFRLIPGMTLTADINVGTRSLFLYVAGGAMRGMGEAMREP
jgi:hemolysin D